MGSHNAKQKLHDNDLEFAQQYRQAGEECYKRKSYQPAIKYFKKALDLGSDLLQNNKTALIPLYKNLGLAYQGLENFEQASYYYKKSLALIKKDKRKHSYFLIEIYKCMMHLHEQEGRFKEAYKISKKRMQTVKKYLGKKHAEFEAALFDLAVSCRKIGESKEALKHFSTLIKLIKKDEGDVHPLLPKCYNYMGLLLKSTDKPQVALSFYKRALKSGLIIYEKTSIELAKIYYNIALAEKDDMNFQEAWGYIRECLKIELINFEENKASILETLKTMVFLAKVCPLVRAEIFDSIDYIEKHAKSTESRQSSDFFTTSLRLLTITDIPKIKKLLSYSTFSLEIEEEKEDSQDFESLTASLKLKKGISSIPTNASMHTQASFSNPDNVKLSQIAINYRDLM